MPRKKTTLNRSLHIAGDVTLIDVSKSDDIDEYDATPGPVSTVCPVCGGSSLIRKGFSRAHTIYHTSRGNTPTLIHTRFRRFLCKDCGVTFTYRPDWIHPWLPVTSSLFTDILKDFSSTKSMREIAADHCVSEGIVRGIFDAVSVKPSLTLSRTVCIDEFKGDAGVYDPESGRWRRRRFQCNVVNGEDRYVIDILPSRDYDSLKAYFQQYPPEEREKVGFLCCDMHSGFAKLRRSVFPKAVLCIDRFHVVKLLNDAVSAVRIRHQKEMKARLALNENDEEADRLYDLLKNSAHLLATKESNFKNYWEPDILAKKKARIAEIHAVFPDLQEMDDYLQEFHVLTAQDNDALRRLALSDWIRRAGSSEVEELRHAADTIKKWQKYILNGLDNQKSNAACEGINRKIKEIKRNASGFKNFENFRKRILLSCGSPLLEKEYSFSRTAAHQNDNDRQKGDQHNEKQPA